MSTPLIVLVVAVLGAAVVYLLVTLGVFGASGRPGDDETDTDSRRDGG